MLNSINTDGGCCVRAIGALDAIFFCIARVGICGTRVGDYRARQSPRAGGARMLPETGTIGEWLVLDAAGEQARKGVRYPILNEGMIGSGRRSDVRLYHPDVLREHAYFVATENGLRIRPVGEAPVYVESQVGGTYHPADGYVDIADGDVLVIGGLRMMLTLFDAHAPRHPVPTPPPISGRTRGRHATRVEEEPFEGDPFYDEERGDISFDEESFDDDFDDDFDASFSEEAQDTERLWRNDANRTRKR